MLAWEILWTEEPDGLQSVGLQRVVPKVVTKEQLFLDYFFFTSAFPFFPD